MTGVSEESVTVGVGSIVTVVSSAGVGVLLAVGVGDGEGVPVGSLVGDAVTVGVAVGCTSDTSLRTSNRAGSFSSV